MEIKRLLGFLTIGLLTFALFFNTSVETARAYYTCGSDDVKCRSARMYYGQQTSVSTTAVYFYRGETIYYSWDNDPAGLFQVGFAVHNSSGKRVSTEKLATKNGDNYGTWPVAEPGYYHLVAKCEGGNDTRCEGGGKLMKW
jgi:hypothetical protein